MKVLIADKFEQSGIDGLKATGCDVVYQPDLKDAALVAGHRRHRRPTSSSSAAPWSRPRPLEAGALSLVVRAGAGYNTIDVATASKRGIYVSNCPGKNAVAVAELDLLRSCWPSTGTSPTTSPTCARARWNKKEYSKARGLFGRTLGLLGYGNIGQEVAKRRARVRDADRRVEPPVRRLDGPTTGLPMDVAATPQEVAERCDVLSVHLALTPETRGLVNASVLDALKPGSYFINTARGEIVDYAALANGRARAPDPGRTRRVRGRAVRCDRRVHRSDRARCRTCTARTTSARRPIRRRKPSRPKPCASWPRTRTPGRCPTS